jgi:hypothetical protein
VILSLSRINTESFPSHLATVQKEILELDGTENRLTTKPKTNKFVVNSIRNGGRKRDFHKIEESTSALNDGTRLERDAKGQLVVFQTGKKPFVISKGNWKKQRNMGHGPRPALGERPERNPHSRKFAKRKAAEQGLEGTDAENEILKNTKCNNCGGSWHISADCKGKKKDKGNKENANPNTSGRSTPGSGTKKYKNYMSKRVGSNTDPCDEEENLPLEEDEDEDRDINPRRLRGFFD